MKIKISLALFSLKIKLLIKKEEILYMRRKIGLEAFFHCSGCLWKPHFFGCFSTWQTSSLWQSPAQWADGKPQASSLIRTLTLPLSTKGGDKQSRHLFGYTVKNK